jgi:hypothetical protein
MLASRVGARGPTQRVLLCGVCDSPTDWRPCSWCAQVRDLWAKRDLGTFKNELSFKVAHHDNMLLTVIPLPDGAPALSPDNSQLSATPPLPTPVDAEVPAHHPGATASVFSWNVHWQCGSDFLRGCRAFAAERFVNLTRAVRASIAVAIELESNSTTPLALDAPGRLEGWQTVAGSCAPTPPSATGDALMLAIDPSKWNVEASGGGCLGGVSGYGYKADSRAFAVASVRPATPVQGCPTLCVVGLHAPHVNITMGAATVERVCRAARKGCVLAAGDCRRGARRQLLLLPAD